MFTSGRITFNPHLHERKLFGEEKQENREDIQRKKESNEENRKLKTLVKTSHRVLLEIHSVFPFDLFPDKLTIDESKVNLTSSVFFYSGRVHSVMIKDISDVLVDSSLIFAILRIIDKGFVENSIELKLIKKSDALKARRIIQGLIMAKDADIDLAKIEDENLVKTIEQLGTTRQPGTLN